MSRASLPGDPQHNYQVVRSNQDWPIHQLRTLVTGGMIAWLRPNTVCDPACGDASLLQAAHMLNPIEMAYLGDISLPNIQALNVTFPCEARVDHAMGTLAVI